MTGARQAADIESALRHLGSDINVAVPPHLRERIIAAAGLVVTQRREVPALGS